MPNETIKGLGAVSASHIIVIGLAFVQGPINTFLSNTFDKRVSLVPSKTMSLEA